MYNTLHSCHNFPAGSREAARVARICETGLISIRLFVHHATSLSSSCTPEGVGLKKCASGTFCLEWSVYLRLSQFSQLSFKQYMGLCIFCLPNYLMMIVKIRVLYLVTIIKSEVWPIWHCLSVAHETMFCVVYLFIFLWMQLLSHVIILNFIYVSKMGFRSSYLKKDFNKVHSFSIGEWYWKKQLLFLRTAI